MAWVKIDDRFDEHPKWDNAPGDSIALWVAAMAWCNRNDSHTGYIPHTKTLGLVNVRSHKATIADLLARGVIHAHEGGYLIHDYEEYQQNEKVKAIRAKRAAAGKLGARARWGDGNGMANAIGLPSDSVANAWQTDGNENAPRPDDPFSVTGSTETTDDSDCADPSSVVVDPVEAIQMTARYMALELVKSARNVRDHNAWVAGTAKTIVIERPDEISHLLAEGMAPADAAEFLTGTSRRQHIHAVEDRETCPSCDGMKLAETDAGYVQCDGCGGIGSVPVRKAAHG